MPTGTPLDGVLTRRALLVPVAPLRQRRPRSLEKTGLRFAFVATSMTVQVSRDAGGGAADHRRRMPLVRLACANNLDGSRTSTMTYSDFTLDSAESTLKVIARPGELFPDLDPVPVPGWLSGLLARGRQVAALVSSNGGCGTHAAPPFTLAITSVGRIRE